MYITTKIAMQINGIRTENGILIGHIDLPEPNNAVKTYNVYRDEEDGQTVLRFLSNNGHGISMRERANKVLNSCYLCWKEALTAIGDEEACYAEIVIKTRSQNTRITVSDISVEKTKMPPLILYIDTGIRNKRILYNGYAVYADGMYARLHPIGDHRLPDRTCILTSREKLTYGADKPATLTAAAITYT